MEEQQGDQYSSEGLTTECELEGWQYHIFKYNTNKNKKCI